MVFNGSMIYPYHSGTAAILYADGHVACQSSWKTGSFQYWTTPWNFVQ